MEPATPPPAPVEDDGYTGAPLLGAVLGTIFFPFISLIAALILQGPESGPRKKAQLRTWAWVSAGWMAFGVVIALIAFGAFAGSVVNHGPHVSRAGPCQGGPDEGAAGTNIPGTDKYVFPCVFGGTATVKIP